ncbi:transforming growth factor-beta-induced protein ig-h3-like [Mya arenaria]|uniref:transforming growth factor-beta-induced protein ig-h3-like n=1 Tax=Mya arenaria TaxID=6604 RepID=UPI0022E4452D|nr:transforming growth factor-beta-induced protein ig-h3-like [Mya arenaria]
MATFRRNRRIDSKLTEELHEEELREEDDWSISGMCLISDENLLVVCDRPQKRLKLFDIDNNIIINHVTLTKQPRSVAAIAGDCVAVTIPEECKIFTYKVCDLRLNMHKMHNFSEHGECYDLDYMDGYLIVTFYPVENGLAALICKYEEEEVLQIQQRISSDANHTIGYVTFDRPAYRVCVYGETIPELATKLGATELVRLVTEAGLAQTLSGQGPFTVFGPTNEAFAKLPKAVIEQLEKNKQLLAEVLKYHVVSGTVYSSQLTNEMTADSLVEISASRYAKIRFNIYNDGKLITAEGSPVTLPNQNASNGVIHVVDRVLYPFPFTDIPGLVTQQIERFSTLLTAVEVANLANTLAGGPFTLFAPTNAAFAKIPTDVLNKLLANVTALADVLKYHLVSGTYWSASLSNDMMPKTVQGEPVTIKIEDSKVMVNDATVQEADVPVTNGVIHVIDTVLMPPMFDSTIY